MENTELVGHLRHLGQRNSFGVEERLKNVVSSFGLTGSAILQAHRTQPQRDDASMDNTQPASTRREVKEK